MSATLLVAAMGFFSFAAFIHLVIFYLESVAWSKPSIWKRFGVRSQADADVIRPMAFNQGYYNAFLAIGVIFGLIMISSSNLHQAGLGVTTFAALSMVLAATVLITSNPKLARAAIFQGATPLIGLVLLGLSLLL
jgi:putative membrane protein